MPESLMQNILEQLLHLNKRYDEIKKDSDEIRKDIRNIKEVINKLDLFNSYVPSVSANANMN